MFSAPSSSIVIWLPRLLVTISIPAQALSNASYAHKLKGLTSTIPQAWTRSSPPFYSLFLAEAQACSFSQKEMMIAPFDPSNSYMQPVTLSKLAVKMFTHGVSSNWSKCNVMSWLLAPHILHQIAKLLTNWLRISGRTISVCGRHLQRARHLQYVQSTPLSSTQVCTY